MRTSAECKRLYTHFITWANTTRQQCQMHCRRTCAQCDYSFVKTIRVIREISVRPPIHGSEVLWFHASIHEFLQVLLESIHIRPKRHHSVRIKSLFNVLLFDSFVRHMRQTKINSFSFCHNNNSYFIVFHLLQNLGYELLPTSSPLVF